MADRFQQLVDDRNRRRFDGRLARAIEDEASARAGKQPENDRVLG